MIYQIKREYIGIGNHKIFLLQRIITESTRCSQYSCNTPYTLERDESSCIGNALLLSDLLRFVVKRKRNGISLEVAHNST